MLFVLSCGCGTCRGRRRTAVSAPITSCSRGRTRFVSLPLELQVFLPVLRNEEPQPSPTLSPPKTFLPWPPTARVRRTVAGTGTSLVHFLLPPPHAAAGWTRHRAGEDQASGLSHGPTAHGAPALERKAAPGRCGRGSRPRAHGRSKRRHACARAWRRRRARGRVRASRLPSRQAPSPATAPRRTDLPWSDAAPSSPPAPVAP
jgi:hypothetical protein